MEKQKNSNNMNNNDYHMDSKTIDWEWSFDPDTNITCYDCDEVIRTDKRGYGYVYKTAQDSFPLKTMVNYCQSCYYMRGGIGKIILTEILPDIENWEAILLRPEFLYHTTMRYTLASEAECLDTSESGDVPLPEFGKYHTNLEVPKFFTVHPEADYGCSKDGYVFLKYIVKERTVMRLLNLIPDKYTLLREIGFKKFNKLLKLAGYDGYIGKEDAYEIYLLNPSKFLKDFIEIPFNTIIDPIMGHKDFSRINEETLIYLLKTTSTIHNLC